MKTKSNIELTRVNINLPTFLVKKVKDYAINLGVNTTTAYIILLIFSLQVNEKFNKDKE